MSDLISRQDAIDAIKGLPTWWADGGGYYGGAQPPMEALLEPNDVISAIDNLPSAQPEDWMERNKERILQAGMEGREIEFRIGGRLFAIREKAQ